MQASSQLYLPLATAFIFWIIGINGNWRRTLSLVGLGYAAIVIACQHYGLIASLRLANMFGIQASAAQEYALGFAVAVVLAFAALLVVFRLMWGSIDPARGEGTSRLAQSALSGIIGWILGTLLVVSLLEYSEGTGLHSNSGYDMKPYSPVLSRTTQVTLRLVSPWLPVGPPDLLREW